MGSKLDAEDFVAGLVMPSADEGAATRARNRWNSIAKPIGSLGQFEDLVVRIAALTGSDRVDVTRRCVVVLCSDNGVVEQGVSQSGYDVTATVARNIARGHASVCAMARPVGVDCLAVDMGMRELAGDPRILDCRIAAGTNDIATGPAMTREEALCALRTGVKLIAELVDEGYQLVATGEMGIGNTTTATAVACTLLDGVHREFVGRGAGLSDAGLSRKTRAIDQALAVNRPDPNDPIDTLAKVGGFDLAGLCGMYLGAAAYRIPIVIDGFISSVAALCAVRMRPEASLAMLPSHLSAEPAAQIVLEHLGLEAPIQAGMHLGEGTGAVCLIALLDMALSLYRGTTFTDCGLAPYEVNPR